MLKVKAFSIEDDNGINELMENVLMTPTILVSESKILVRYEDGSEPTLEQKIVGIKDERSLIQKQLDLIIHSNKVLELQMERVKETGVISKEVQATHRMNHHEINRLKANIDVFNDTILELSK